MAGARIGRVSLQCGVDVYNVVVWIYGSTAGVRERLSSFPWLVMVCSAVAIGVQLASDDEPTPEQSLSEVGAVVDQAKGTAGVRREPLNSCRGNSGVRYYAVFLDLALPRRWLPTLA